MQATVLAASDEWIYDPLRPKVWGDFETYSEVDIKVCGGMAYVRHDSTNPVCFSWAVDNEAPHLWTPDKPSPVELLELIKGGAYFYAHNMKFDFRVWNYIMHRDFGWPLLDLDQCIDTQALAATYGLPLSLQDAGGAMNIANSKLTAGKKLIKLLCTPDKNGNQPHPRDPVYQARFMEFYEYAKQDVRAMREFVQKLPRQHLIPQEHKIWKLTYEMNTIGLPIAYDEVQAIKKYLTAYIEQEMIKVPLYTNGAVEKITQTVKLKQWVCDNGYEIPDMTAATVEASLEDPECPEHIRRVMELRQELGKSSVAKFQKLIDQAVIDVDGNYWIYDNLEFHGAGPGRWAARGFQMHNLPRAKVDNPDEYIERFVYANGAIGKVVIENPVGLAKALIRPMIKAHQLPKRKVLLVLDYSSIENKLLHWLAGDYETLDEFKRGLDQYKTMASERYRVTYENVDKAQRQMGKVIILGSGFGMGWETFIETAKTQFGMVVTEEEARLAILAYRTKYTKVVALWNNLKTAAAATVITGKRHTVGKITFGLAKVNGITWLAMLLPSGKCVYYCEPRVEQRYIPKYEHMGKVPTITHLGRHPKTGRWTRLALIPGRITENAVQGTAREVMARGLLNVHERMEHVTVIGTVHDEGLSITDTDHFTEDTMREYAHHLCDIPWAKDCPITASGFAEIRYKKD